MELKINIPIKANDVIYTVIRCKIERLYVKDVGISGTINNVYGDISHLIDINADRFNDGINSTTFALKLDQCFLSKKDLINQLDK